MRLIPRTLLWRTFLLVALLMLLSVWAWFEIYSRFEREPRAMQLAQLVVSVANLTRASLLTAQPEKRAALLQELSDREGIRIYPSEPDEAIVPLPDAPVLRLMTAEVRRQLGLDTRLAWEREAEQGLWVSFRIEDDEYWVKLPPERLQRVFPQHLLGWGAAALALSLIGAYLIVFRVTRPLKALARAASSIGSGEQPAPLEERGPLEIRTLTHAFNEMSDDLKQLDADRALILAGISHDLRTPLARLRLGVELSGADTQTREGMAADIDEMDKVIGQFLDFAREASGEALDLCDLKGLCADIAEQYRRRGIAIDSELADLPPIPLRTLAIRRSIANLIDNAWRYAGATMPIELRCRGEDGVAIVEVLDRGPGIPPQQVERLKRPFTRLDSARSGATGAGLGLAIVDRVARAHQGQLRLLAREGGGLTAQLRLPAAPVPQAQRPAA